MSEPTPGDWVIPVANIFRVLAVDENGKPARLIHDQPDMVSYFGDVKLEWQENDGPEAAANTRLFAASKRLLAACEKLAKHPHPDSCPAAWIYASGIKPECTCGKDEGIVAIKYAKGER